MLLPLLLSQTALAGGTVHSMVEGEPPRAATVVIEEGRIAAVLGPDEAPPEAAEVVDVSGFHLVPGLVDAHVYFDRDHDALYVSQGVTLVRDMALEPFRAAAERSPERRDRVPGPALLTAGATIDGDPPSSMEAVVLREPADAERNLPILFDEDVDFLSVREGLSLDVLRRVAELAHELGIEVWGVRPEESSVAEALEAGLDGVTLIETLLPPGVQWSYVQPAAFDSALAALSDREAAVVPILGALGARIELQEPESFPLERLHPMYENWWRDELALRARGLDDSTVRTAERVAEKQRALLLRLFEAGVPLVPGSGAPRPWLLPGDALHRELALWQEAGIPAADVLRLATAGAARELGVAEDRGTIAPGKVADVVAVARDPSEDVGALRDPELVVVRGRVLPRAELDARTAKLAEALAAVREKLAQPIEVPEPDLPEGSPVLAGLVRTAALGRVVRAERFAVVLEPDGAIAFVGRSMDSGRGDGEPRDMTVLQRVRDGRLVEFEIDVRSGDEELVARGIHVAGTWRIERDAKGLSLPLRRSRERFVTLDVGSVTTLLVLAHTVREEPFAVVAFHEGLEPERVAWKMRWGVTEDGLQHQVRTHLGLTSFFTTANGAVEVARHVVGNGALETVLVEEQTFGGPGLPLPRAKREAPVFSDEEEEDAAEEGPAPPEPEDGGDG